MKHFLFLLAVLMISAAAFAQSAETEQAIKTKEKALLEALKNGDTAAFRSSLSARHYTGVYGWGLVSMQEEVDGITNITLNSYEMSDVTVSQPADNVAVITYMVNLDGDYQGEDFSGDYNVGSTWVKIDGAWKMVMHTEAGTDMEMEMDMDMDADTDMDY